MHIKQQWLRYYEDILTLWYTTISSMNTVQKNLSPLEQGVMNIVWNLQTCSIREAREQLQQGKEFAYTTVATIFARLYDKGVLKREKKNSVMYYSPKISRENFSKKLVGAFFSHFFESFGDTAIASFVESIEDLPKEKKNYLLKLLEKHNENQ